MAVIPDLAALLLNLCSLGVFKLLSVCLWFVERKIAEGFVGPGLFPQWLLMCTLNCVFTGPVYNMPILFVDSFASEKG